jgi:hypothetical protein
MESARVEIESRIAEEGAAYTAEVWKMLKAKNKTLSPEDAELYDIIQKAHYRLTGHQLPHINGARRTRAQARDDLGPEVKEEVIAEAVKGGLAARLAKLRSE